MIGGTVLIKCPMCSAHIPVMTKEIKTTRVFMEEGQIRVDLSLVLNSDHDINNHYKKFHKEWKFSA